MSVPTPQAFLTPLSIKLNTASNKTFNKCVYRHRSIHLTLASPPPPLRPSNSNTPPSDHRPPLTHPITGEKDLSNAIESTPHESNLVVVMFHARWCRVCKTLATKLDRIIPNFPNVTWLSVDFANIENKPLCANLDVKILPTFHFYKPIQSLHDGPVDSFTAGPFGAKRLVEHLEAFQCQLTEKESDLRTSS